MKLDVIETSDPAMTPVYENLVKNYTDQIFRVNSIICNALHDTVDRIVNYVSASGSINILRFWGHGTDHMQRLNQNENGDDDTGDNNAFWMKTVYANAYYLQKLTPLFAADGIMELHGSRIASGTDGEMFLIKIAASVNVPVVGQDQIQMGAGSIISAATGTGWEAGMVTMGYPDYTVAYGPGSSL